MFSILIPSRNRLELLGRAIESVRRQGYDDYEVVVSDNASDEDYAGYVASLDDSRIRVVRSDQPLSVTENWNRALEASRGDYFVMLGDDDALAPGYLAHQAQLIESFEQPDVLYAIAYHYAYPGVVPGWPGGYLATVANSPLFVGHPGPYWLDVAEMRRLGRRGMSFRHDISFNAQHFMYRRGYVDGLAKLGPFYQSPYPDYYAAFVTFRTAQRLIADPHPRIIIGIARQSFGYFAMNQQEEEGASRFLTDPMDRAFLAEGDAAIERALDFPGTTHTRNWLLAALQARRRLGETDLGGDLRRYARLQLMELAVLAGYERRAQRVDYRRTLAGLTPAERRFGERALRSAMTARIADGGGAMLAAVRGLLGVYYPARVQYHPFDPMETILDAVERLTPVPAAPEAPPPEPEPEPEPEPPSPSPLELMQAERDALAAELTRREELLAGLEEALAGSQRAVEAASRREAGLATERDELLECLNEVLDSPGWRMTRPLRRLLDRRGDAAPMPLASRKPDK
ncbi:glycosyltransferase family 2 protein [Caulobacter endophyticus]|uniref:glycosyltransferase family 2 protein n=1 Tax=Caulobacter endophyticus TaxID=2172652 RepID=UPI00240FA6C1|nr:glycosyltransferase family 2 protein [Caulobacter endophyticus]MDG2528798.1 glycosyltransferase family 2 protein [Caulobacter endophyticus]